MSLPRTSASRILQSALRESRTVSPQPFQRRYAGNTAGDSQSEAVKYLTRPEVIAAVVVSIPLGWYFLRASPMGGASPSRRPAEGSPSPSTPEEDYHREVASNIRIGNEEKAISERKDLMGTEQSTGNYRASDNSTSSKRGRKHENPTVSELLGQTESIGNPAKHSTAIDQDKTKSKKSTGEPETAKAQSTVLLNRR